MLAEEDEEAVEVEKDELSTGRPFDADKFGEPAIISRIHSSISASVSSVFEGCCWCNCEALVAVAVAEDEPVEFC